jgi:hypothetical protein
MNILGVNYSYTQKKLYLYILVCLVLISSSACQGSHDKQTGDQGVLNSGLMTILSHGSDNPNPYPYQIDFSELDRAYYKSHEEITVIEPDLHLSEGTLRAPYGLKEHGRIWRLFCYHPPYGVPSYEKDDQPILNKYRRRFFFYSFIPPIWGYQTNLKLKLCHRYYIRTAEGETVLLINLGRYIGGINRIFYFWSYVAN